MKTGITFIFATLLLSNMIVAESTTSEACKSSLVSLKTSLQSLSMNLDDLTTISLPLIMLANQAKQSCSLPIEELLRVLAEAVFGEEAVNNNQKCKSSFNNVISRFAPAQTQVSNLTMSDKEKEQK